MGNPGTPFFSFLCALLVLLFLQSSSKASLMVGDQKYFDYDQNSKFGPQHWGDLYPDWAACKNGKEQSPIDIHNKNIKGNSSGKLVPSYKSNNAIMKNKSHGITINWADGKKPGAGSLLIDGKNYVLKQCHWHSPSEHTFSGKRYPLELHMVHVGQNGSIAVVGIMYRYGSHDSFPQVENPLKVLIANKKDEVSMGHLSPPPIKSGAPYYKYPGSLTTPPCTEKVTWILLQEVWTVPERLVHLLRIAVHGDNARPIQPIHGRNVTGPNPGPPKIMGVLNSA